MRIGLLRKVAAYSTALLLVVGLAGCGNAYAGSSDSSQEGSSTESTKVTTIHAGTTANPAPFTFKDEDGNLQGQNIDLVKAIFKELPQYKLEWSTAEMPAVFTGLDAGRYQIAVNNLSKNKEREAKYIFSDPIYFNRYVAVTAENSSITKLDDLADLAGKKVFTDTTGTAMSLALQSYNKENPDKQINLVYTQADISGQIQKVQDGEADTLIMSEPVFGYYKKKTGLNVTSVPLEGNAIKQVGAQNYSFLVFAKDQTQLRDDVNKALEKIIKDGTSKKINEQWFGKDLSPEI